VHSLILCSRNSDPNGGALFLASAAGAGIAYLVAIREILTTPTLPRRVVITGLVLAAAWHIAFLRVPPGADDDIHRYVWDGRLQRLGYNPYLVVPNDPAYQWLHTPETRTLNHPDPTSLYPPGAELFFRAVTSIHESTFALRVAFLVCDVGIVFLLLDVLRRTQQGAHLILAYAWNPLLAIEVAGSGHIDIVGALLLLISAAALARRWRTPAAVGLGLAVSVKLLPIILLPLYWKRIRIRDAALAIGIVAVLCSPFLNHGRLPTGSLGTYVHSFRFNGPVFAALEQVAPSGLIAGIAVLVGIFTALWFRRKSDSACPDAFAWPMAASLFCAPVVYPWYLLWLLPFARLVSALPLIVWTVSILPTYYVWHLRAVGRPWILPGWILLLEYGCVVMAMAMLWPRRIKGLDGVAAHDESVSKNV
jgi:hypothetical protein